MNGNTPYAGRPGVTQAGRRAPADVPELTPDQKRVLREHVSDVVTLTRDYLPDAYAVGGELRQGAGGPEAAVAVEPPVGHPVSAGFTPDGEDVADADFEPREVARGLAATAALQVKQTLDGDETMAAR
jgi:hypothetical protein